MQFFFKYFQSVVGWTHRWRTWLQKASSVPLESPVHVYVLNTQFLSLGRDGDWVWVWGTSWSHLLVPHMCWWCLQGWGVTELIGLEDTQPGDSVYQLFLIKYFRKREVPGAWAWLKETGCVWDWLRLVDWKWIFSLFNQHHPLSKIIGFTVTL